ncbi:MAG: nuclear transport factor 2 family protein [Acidobacteriota bacterium]
MKICPNCQRKYSDSLEYCLADGTVLSQMEDPNATLRIEAHPTQSSSPANRSLPVWVFVLAGVFVIGIVGVAGITVFYFGTGDAALTPARSNNSTSSNSAGVDVTDPRSGMERETETIKQINSGLCVAMVQSDVAAINQVLADDYTYSNDLGPNWRLNKEQTLTAYRMGRIRYESVTAPDPKIEMNKDLNRAVASGRAYTRGWLVKQPFNNSYLYQNNYEKRQDRWQLVKSQAWYH